VSDCCEQAIREGITCLCACHAYAPLALALDGYDEPADAADWVMNARHQLEDRPTSSH